MVDPAPGACASGVSHHGRQCSGCAGPCASGVDLERPEMRVDFSTTRNGGLNGKILGQSWESHLIINGGLNGQFVRKS